QVPHPVKLHTAGADVRGLNDGIRPQFVLQVEIVILHVRSSLIDVYRKDGEVVRRKRTRSSTEDGHARSKRNDCARRKRQVEHSESRQRIERRAPGSAVLKTLQQEIVL